ncbi:MAG: DUF883 domain-containing protein [Burkholderiales bacterium]|nr:DUF883 domain-containing protein [Burkholderiales bacterium]
MNNTIEAREKLSADFRLVMDDIDALMSATTNKAEGEVTALRARIHDRLDSAKQRVADAQHDAFKQAKLAADATNDYVRTHPWQAAGAGAAIGLAIGVLIGRR